MGSIYLVSYDIKEDRLRIKVAAKLQYYGLYRVQYSVFMGKMNPTVFVEASRWIHLQTKPKDRILILPLSPKIADSALRYGQQIVHWDEITGRKNTLYIE